MKRRSFFVHFCQLLALFAISLFKKPEALAQPVKSQKVSQKRRIAFPSNGRRIPLLQGMTNQNSAQIIVLVPFNAQWTYQVTSDDQTASLSVAVDKRMTNPNSRYGVERITITGIKNPDSKNQLRIMDADGKVLDERTFRGLDTTKSSVKLAFISCMDSRNPIQSDMWAGVISQRPDLMIFSGDCVYADGEGIPTTIEAIWQRYIETRLQLDIFQAQELIPTLAVWDDHDFGMDDANRTFHLKDEVLPLFKGFFGSADTAELKNGPAVSSYLKAFGQRFVIFDSRYYRDPIGSQSPREAKQWGDNQTKWFYSKLDSHSTEPVWFINGSQFYGGYRSQFESVEREAPTELKALQSKAQSLNAPAVLVSGDVHYSEIMELEETLLGCRSLEITSSSIHSYEEPDTMGSNRRRLFSTSKFNYVIARVQAGPSELNLDLIIYGENGSEYFQSTHKVSKT